MKKMFAIKMILFCIASTMSQRSFAALSVREDVESSDYFFKIGKDELINELIKISNELKEKFAEESESEAQKIVMMYHGNFLKTALNLLDEIDLVKDNKVEQLVTFKKNTTYIAERLWAMLSICSNTKNLLSFFDKKIEELKKKQAQEKQEKKNISTAEIMRTLPLYIMSYQIYEKNFHDILSFLNYSLMQAHVISQELKKESNHRLPLLNSVVLWNGNIQEYLSKKDYTMLKNKWQRSNWAQGLSWEHLEKTFFDIDMGILNITGNYIPFSVQKTGFHVATLPMQLFSDSEDTVEVITHDGKFFEQDGLLFKSDGERWEVLLVGGTAGNHPLRGKLLLTLKELPRNIRESIPEKYRLFLDEKESTGCMYLPFYETEEEKEYLKIEFLDMYKESIEQMKEQEFLNYEKEKEEQPLKPTLLQALSYDQKSDSVSFDFDSKDEAEEGVFDGKKEKEEDVESKSVIIEDEQITEEKRELIQSKKMEYFEVVDKEQKPLEDKLKKAEFEKEKRRAVIEEKESKKDSSKKGPKQKQIQKQKKGKKQIQKEKKEDSQVSYQKTQAAIKARAQKIYEEHKENGRLKMRVISQIFNAVDKEIKEAQEEFDIKKEESSVNVDGSHNVLHGEGKPLTLVRAHGHSKDNAVRAKNFNEFLEGYINAQLLDGMEEVIFKKKK